MIANSGRFKNTLPLILKNTPFENFMALSDALYESVGSTWKISLQRLFVLIFEALKADVAESELFEAMQKDYALTAEKASLESLLNKKTRVTRIGVANKRQRKVLQK